MQRLVEHKCMTQIDTFTLYQSNTTVYQLLQLLCTPFPGPWYIRACFVRCLLEAPIVSSGSECPDAGSDNSVVSEAELYGRRGCRYKLSQRRRLLRHWNNQPARHRMRVSSLALNQTEWAVYLLIYLFWKSYKISTVEKKPENLVIKTYKDT